MIDNVQIEELYKQMAQSIIDGESEQAVELSLPRGRGRALRGNEWQLHG